MNRLITSNELKSRTSAIHSFRLRNRIHRMEAEENYILKYEMLSINLFSLKVSERVSVSHLNVRLLKLASYTIRQFDMYLPRSQDTLPSYPLLWVFL